MTQKTKTIINIKKFKGKECRAISYKVDCYKSYGLKYPAPYTSINASIKSTDGSYSIIDFNFQNNEKDKKRMKQFLKLIIKNI